jgi:alpha-mannosidase
MFKSAGTTLLVLLLVAGTVEARHPVLRSSMRAIVGSDRIELRISTSLEEPLAAAGLTPGDDGTYAPRLVDAAVRDYAVHLLGHLTVSADGRPLAGRHLRTTSQAPPHRGLSRWEIQQLNALYELEYPGHPKRELTFEQSVLRDIEYAPGFAWTVTYAADLGWGGTSSFGLLRAGRPWTVPAPPSAPSEPPHAAALPGPTPFPEGALAAGFTAASFAVAVAVTWRRSRKRKAALAALLLIALADPLCAQQQKKKVYVAPDDHTDFIWSDTEANYEKWFMRMLDYYVEQAGATSDAPAMLQSRFSTDGTYWLAVYERNKRPEEFRQLIERIKDGHIGCPIVPLVVCYGGMPAEAILRSMYYPGLLERRYGLRFTVAHDIENQTTPYGLGALWAGAGARYAWKGVCNCSTLVKGLNERQHEMYRWVGQDRSSLLMKWFSIPGGNQSLGGYAEARDPRRAIDLVSSRGDSDNFRKRHPYDIIGVFGQGWDDKFTTNLAIRDACKAMSDDQRDCIVSNEEDFFVDFERAYGATLPVQSLGFGNEWELAAVSMAEVSARVKRAVEQLRAAEALASLVSLKNRVFMDGRTAARDRAFMDLGLYFEHDFAPGGPGATAQERIRFQRRMADEIEAYVRPLHADAAVGLAGLIPRPQGAIRFFVFNPLGWMRTDAADLPYDGSAEVHVVDVTTGSEVPSQLVAVEGRLRLRILATDIPPVGYKVFELVPGAPPELPRPTADAGTGAMENVAVALTVDPRGAITSLKDKTRGGREGVRTIDGYAMNDLDPAAKGTLSVENAGPVSVTLLAAASATDANPPHATRVTLYRDVDRIEIENRVVGTLDDTVRLWRFGFNIDGGVVRHEEVGAILRAKTAREGGPYADQNARYDYLTLNHFADLSDDGTGITLSNADAFFMRVGRSTVQKLDSATPQISPVLAAGGKTLGFAMMRGQAGDSFIVQRFALKTHGAFRAADAMKFSLEHQNPLVAGMVIGGTGYPADRYSLVSVSDPSVLLWSIKPAEEGIGQGLIARLWNLAEAPSSFSLSLTPGLNAAHRTTHIETNLAEAAVKRGTLTGNAAGLQLVTYRLMVP